MMKISPAGAILLILAHALTIPAYAAELRHNSLGMAFVYVPPGEFRQALGVTRKHLIPLLEYMDRVGVTRRTPEGRILNEEG